MLEHISVVFGWENGVHIPNTIDIRGGVLCLRLTKSELLTDCWTVDVTPESNIPWNKIASEPLTVMNASRQRQLVRFSFIK